MPPLMIPTVISRFIGHPGSVPACPSLSRQTLAEGQEYSQSCKTASTDRSDCPANPSCVFLTSRLTPNRLCPERRVLLVSLNCLMRHRRAAEVKNKRMSKIFCPKLALLAVLGRGHCVSDCPIKWIFPSWVTLPPLPPQSWCPTQTRLSDGGFCVRCNNDL